jgi:hypothetical protein
MDKVETVWMLFDGRYLSNPDRAVCYEVCTSVKEARQNAPDYGNDTVIVKGHVCDGEFVASKIVN